MMDPKLHDYVKKHLDLGYPPHQLKDHLLNYGWPMGEIDQVFDYIQEMSPLKQSIHGSKKKRKAWIFFLVIFLVLASLLVFSYAYLNAPSHVEKPALDTPPVAISGEAIAAQHIEYMFNELGAYQLQDDLI